MMLIASPLLVGWLVVRLPADYFTVQRRQPPAFWERHRVLRPVILVVKNLVGVILIAAGLVMLFVPGQGLLTVAVGLMLLDFPGKRGFERRLPVLDMAHDVLDHHDHVVDDEARADRQRHQR